MTIRLPAPFVALAILLPGLAEAKVELGSIVSETRGFAASHGEVLWPGYGSAPFGFLLLEEDKEVLICQPGKHEGFTSEGADGASGCERWSRPRTKLPNGLLAAMPMLGPPATIVMGTPESTGRAYPAWLHTILHEHFHQWQWSRPDHYARVDALGLNGGDKTGMWMLNYAFPYDAEAVGRAYSAASRTLAEALEHRGKADFPAHFDRYLDARRRFQSSVDAKDWRYLELQLWQEGTARWTEIQLGKIYPDAAVRESALALEKKTIESLKSPNIKDQKRELAYPFGAAEAMLMSACGPSWRDAYPSSLSHGPLLAGARKACSFSDPAGGRPGRPSS